MQGDYYSVPMTHASTIKLGVIVEGWQFLSLLNHCKMTKQVPKGNHPEERSKEATQRRKPTRGPGAKSLLYSTFDSRKKFLASSGTTKHPSHEIQKIALVAHIALIWNCDHPSASMPYPHENKKKRIGNVLCVMCVLSSCQ